MIDHLVICPYTGLRSFTEEESLYFKGRDLQVDQITSLLEQNKFLMVTGASGEGKSSLIYAGLIPNARAGFFKAKYTNWVVADFRPERSPVKNMADALAETFESKSSSIETELRRGYSSLIDLYTNSDFHIDETDDQWNNLAEPQKKERKRKAANLMILVDQFEEFFTNPENFFNEAPSQDSQIVVNLILETARIAIKKNLPVYVVCTMRSDYIGQCSAFRGLPEYIGFSQFFVPRLKRKDLKQVIEEPAVLSGNRISQRLIERLVFDIADGIDQLPILQHALSQVWLAADHGQEVMDLIHYAMVGGMPANDLPDEDQPKFRTWFDSLTPVRQKYYQNTGLNKIIEIHASILYENAWEKYNLNHPDTPITQIDAKKIIEQTFSCLTKIDNSRAVRNRMTLGEITSIINNPAFTTDVVSDVLSIYREEGNSFIRPFKTDDPATHKISADTVLDITHESLIRNWNKLNTWANQEYEYYSTYLDFKKQLDRWKKSGKSMGFLLPIGPLSYFENWYNECNPNVGWIKRYSEIQEDQSNATAEAESVLADVREFIRRSARKVAITRAFMKYGPQRIAAVFAIVFVIVLSGFYWYDAEQKQNARVIEKAREEVLTLMKSKEIGFDAKSLPLLMEERSESGYTIKYLNSLDAKGKLSLAIESYKLLLIFDKHDKSQFKTELIDLTHDVLKELLGKETDYTFLITQLNKFTTLLAYDNYYNPSEASEKMLREFTNEGYTLANILFTKKDLYKAIVPPEINYGVQLWLTFGNVTDEKIKSMLKLFSPYEEGDGQKVFNVYYQKGTYEVNGTGKNDFNGGYQTLASLYAASGNIEKVIKCFDEIKKTGQNDYFGNTLYNSYTNILGIIYQFGHSNKKEPVLQWLTKNYQDDSPTNIYFCSITRAGYISHLYLNNFQRQGGVYYSPNLCLAKREVFNAISDDYEKYISELKNQPAKNFLLAINEKRKAMYIHAYQYDRGLVADTSYLDKFLQKSIDYYKLVDKSYLDETETVTQSYFIDGTRTRNLTRRQIFLYPDYMNGFFSHSYHSDLFFNFLDRNNLFESLYKSPEDLSMLHYWIAKAFEVKPYMYVESFENRFPISDNLLLKYLSITKTHSLGRSLDKNLVCLLLANRAFARKDVEAGMNYYHLFDKDNFADSRDKYEYLQKTFFLNQLKDLCVNLSIAGKQKEAVELVEKFEKEHEKAFAYLFMAEKIFVKQSDPLAFVYLDSVYSKSKDIDFSQLNFDNRLDHRYKWIFVMSRIGGRQLGAMSDKLLADIIQGTKFGGVLSRLWGLAEEGNFYRAKSAIPATLTETEDLFARTVIEWQAIRKNESLVDKTRWSAMDNFIERDNDYVFYMTN